MSIFASAFAIRDFRLLTQSRFLFMFGVQVQAVVMGWQMYQLKKDPLFLGLIGLAEAFPALTVSLISGYIVDRSNPLKIYRTVVLVSLASAGILLTVSAPGLLPGAYATDSARVGAIFGAAVLTGLARGFVGPSLFALIPQIVPRKILSESAAWTTSAFQMAAVGGPTVGGLLYAWQGAFAPYAMVCVVLLGASLSLTQVSFKPAPHPPSASTEPIFERLASGIRYVFKTELLLSAMSLDMFAVLFGGVTAILPIFAEEILHVGPSGLGILRSAPAAGALLMSLFLIRHPISKNAGRLLLGVVAGFGLCMIGFAFSRNFWLSGFLLALSGALDSVSMVVRGTIVQLSSPESMRGRIAAVNSFFIGSSNEIGAFESGLAARLLGTVPSVVFGGCMTLLTVASVGYLAPRLRETDLSKL